MNPLPWFRRQWITLIVRITPRCADMTRLISQSLDGGLPPATRLRMHLHYLICVWCLRYRNQLRFLHDHAREFDQHMPMGSSREGLRGEARDRIRAALKQGR
jgi:hypothetical protein